MKEYKKKQGEKGGKKFQKGYFQNKGVLLEEESYKRFRPLEINKSRSGQNSAKYEIKWEKLGNEKRRTKRGRAVGCLLF